MLQDKLTDLREMLIAQANAVESMLVQCRRGLESGDRGALEATIGASERAVNRMELGIDEACIGILALQHPEAKDLRFTLMVFRMTTDLERIGDCAVNIAESALAISGRLALPGGSATANGAAVSFRDELLALAEAAGRMVGDSLDAFIHGNAALARGVCGRDEAVDAMRDGIWKGLCAGPDERGGNIGDWLHVLRIANNYEKIADVSTNIAEETIYALSGSVIKHHQLDGAEGDA